MTLSLLLLIPALGALLLMLLPAGLPPQRGRVFTLVVLALQLLWSLRVLLAFDPSEGGLQLQESLSWVGLIGLDFRLGIDGLSLPLMLHRCGEVVIGLPRSVGDHPYFM